MGEETNDNLGVCALLPRQQTNENSALEALRNALYKFKTYLHTNFKNVHVVINTEGGIPDIAEPTRSRSRTLRNNASAPVAE